MILVQSLHGISHNKIEHTKKEHLALAVTAFDKLANKAMRWDREQIDLSEVEGPFDDSNTPPPSGAL